MSIPQEMCPNQRIMQQALQNHTHETCITHIVETSKADGTAGDVGGIGGHQAIIIGTSKLF
jgi:hypothetical protein